MEFTHKQRSFALKLSASTRLSEQQATVVNVSEECLDRGTALSVPLELKGLFVLRETTDEAQWGGFPGSSRLKHNFPHNKHHRECRVVCCGDKTVSMQGAATKLLPVILLCYF